MAHIRGGAQSELTRADVFTHRSRDPVRSEDVKLAEKLNLIFLLKYDKISIIFEFKKA